MKKFLLILSIAILGCSFPLQFARDNSTPTAMPAQLPTQTLPASELGTTKNPLILALAPSAHPDGALTHAGNVIAAFIEKQTGYHVVTTIPLTQADLVDSFQKGNAHIASLTPFAYLLVRENNSATAVLGSVRDGQLFYGAQFIANRDSNFVSYYDASRSENTADAAHALSQFQNKKPCWTDAISPSGYVVPLGLLNQASIQVSSAAFLEGHPSVVRAVYAESICDFGTTFIDARTSPTLEAKYPDVMEKVVVIWRVPDMIPYENISVSTSLPLEMRRMIQRAFIDLMLTPDGKAAVQTAYGIDELQAVDDTMYAGFASVVIASGLNLSDLIK
jgi:phosphonate transport system substrate-binding protein